jgi:hypothetical protein
MHRHICADHGVGSVGGTHFHVIPDLDGVSLAAHLEKPRSCSYAITVA